MKQNLFKRVLSLVLCLLMVLTVVPMADLSVKANAANNICYTEFNSAEYSYEPGQYMANIALAQEGRNGASFGYSTEWCAYFISDCARIAGQEVAIPSHYNVSELCANIEKAGGKPIYDARKNTGSLYDAKIGDIVVVDTSKGGGNTRMSHVEIVYKVLGNQRCI